MNHFYTLTSEQINDFFIKVNKNKNSIPLLPQILTDKNTHPLYLLVINNRKYYFSSIIQTPNRQQIFMYTIVNKLMVPRVLYKSISKGLWSSCVGAIQDLYSETKIVDFRILQFLEEINICTKSNIDYILKFFQLNIYNKDNFFPNPLLKNINTYHEENFTYKASSLLKFLQIHAEHEGFSNIYKPSDYISSLITQEERYPEFFPNFSKKYKNKYILNHDILGEVIYETYEATLSGKKIEWVFAYDKNKRVWIDSIFFSSKEFSQINSYGVNSITINSGFLTTKPLISNNFSKNLIKNDDYITFNKYLIDISLLINKFPIIEKFKKHHFFFLQLKSMQPNIKIDINSLSFYKYSKNFIVFFSGLDKKKYVFKHIEYNWEYENEVFLYKNNIKFNTFNLPKILYINNNSIMFEHLNAIDSRIIMTEEAHSQSLFLKIINTIDEIDNQCLEIKAPNCRMDRYHKKYTIQNINILIKRFPVLKKYKDWIINFDEKTIKTNQIIHGDFRLINMMYNTESKDLYILDWERLAYSDRNIDYMTLYSSFLLNSLPFDDEYYQIISQKKYFDKNRFFYFFIEKEIEYLVMTKSELSIDSLYSAFNTLFINLETIRKKECFW